MQILTKIGKIAAVGTMAALVTGSSIASAQLDKFPAPFVDAGQSNALIVVGAKAAPSDVVGAIDIAARLGGETSTTVTVSGAQVPVSISGEGKEIATKTTQILLQDTLGKTGLRNTLTSDDLPSVLKTGSFSDVDRGTTHKYRQFIDLTPVGTTANYRLDYDKATSTSGADPSYNFGRFTTAPSATEYLYKTRVVFDVGVNGSTAVGEKITLFGKDYTISSGTSSSFGGTSTDKLVLFGGAISQILQGGETITTTVGGTTYSVTLVGASTATVAVIKVGTDQRSVTKGSSAVTIGGLDVYVDDVFLINTNDQTQNSVKVLLGAEQVTLQEGSKVKLGKDETSVDGTFVDLSTSAGLLTQIAVTVGGASSTNDFLSLGGSYTDTAWKTFKIGFTSMSGGLKAGNQWEVRNSGDSSLVVTGKDDKNQDISGFNWAYKGTTAATQLLLGDNNGDIIHVVENDTISRDQYLVLDAGGFPHIYEVTSVSLDGTTSSSIDLRDVVSGTTTKITAGTDNQETAVIDGQNYNFANVSSTSFRVTWGTNSALGLVGDFITVFPAIKGKNGEWVAFANGTNSVPIMNGMKYQFPTGAFTLTETAGLVSFTAANKEDGTTSVVSSTGLLNTSVSGSSAIVTVGRTATGATKYNLTQTSATTMNVRVAGTGTTLTQPSIIIVEEKDSDGNQAAVIIPATTEVSGSSNLAIAGAPDLTAGVKSGSQTWGSDSNIDSQVDIWGTYIWRDTKSQDNVKVFYPDDQVTANIVVLKSDAVATSGGSSAATTLKSAVPIKTALGKLDTEITNADKTTMNLILVGGPVVNTLVAELATAGKTRDTQFFRDNGPGTSIIDLVSDAFTAGKSALVVAGYEAAETREAAKWVQTFDSDPAKSAFTGRSRVVIKSGVLSTTTV